MIRFKKGSVWQCDLSILGNKRRPCVIISDDEFNRSNDSKVVNVVPLSTSLDVDSDNARHLQMKIIDDKLCQPLVEYTYPCNKNCIQNFVGFLDEDELATIEAAFVKHFSNLTGMTVIEKPVVAVEAVKPEPKKEKSKTKPSKYSDEEKKKIVDTYDDSMKNNDRKSLQRLADVYSEGNLTKLSKLASYCRIYLRDKGEA